MRTRFKSLVAAVTALAMLSACGGADKSASPEAPAAQKKVQRPAIQTQQLMNPCEWLPQAQVEQVIGNLVRAPRRGLSAESPRPDEEGNACVYPVAAAEGEVKEIALQVDLYGASAFESAMGMMGNLFAQELNDGHGETPAAEKRTDGWDYVGALPDQGVWRVGHVAVLIGSEAFSVPQETLGRLAVAVRDRLSDLPFAIPGSDPNAPGSPPDPCALLTRAEAEAVLGKLIVEPYRSAESGAIAEAEGPSCSFYSAGHRVLVITPTWSDGETMFGMAGGIGGLIRSKTGGADEGDILDGPWDQATAGTTGALYFLKGDRMLEVVYKTAATDAEGAAKLAAAAVGRL